MIKHFFILITLTLICLFSYGQSYIGFSGGYYLPKINKNEPRHQSSGSGPFTSLKISAKSKPSFFFAANYQERTNKIFNLGISLIYKLQLINYVKKTFTIGHFKSHNNTIADYQNHYLNFLVNLEFKPIKRLPVFFNISPSIDFLIHSKKHEMGNSSSTSYSPFTNSTSEKWDIKENNHDAANSKFAIYLGLNYEYQLSKNKILFLSLNINRNFAETFDQVKTLDIMIGIGIRFSLPNFNFGKINKNIFVGQPYILHKK